MDQNKNKKLTSFEKRITIGSLFDGSGGFPLAGALNGAIPLWASEIEPYPIAVTHSRFPNMKHLGSVTDIHGGDIDPVDIITFGSPCQDMSIAGKRAGMQHEAKGDEGTTRSGLFYEAVRIIREMREKTNGEYPKYAIWENVTGAYSSNNGSDFHCVLEELYAFCTDEKEFSIPRPENGKWARSGEIVGDRGSIAWRTLDAQYWGVPQRRKRIYLVADFNSDRAGKILFERDCLLGNSAQGREEREEVSTDVGGSVERGCISFAWANSANAGLSNADECSPTIKASQCGEPAVVKYLDAGDTMFMMPDKVNCLNPWDCQSKRQYGIDGVYRTLDAGQSCGGQAHGVVYSIDALSSNSMKSHNPNSGFHETEYAKCLDTSGCNPACNQGGNVVVGSFMGGQGAKAGSVGYSESVSPTIKSVMSGGNTVPDIVYPVNSNSTVYGVGGYSLNYQNPVIYNARGNGDGQTVPTITGDHENRITDYTAICCQNTGRGWWNQSEIAETLRTPCGGDSVKANLVVCVATGQANAEIMENMSPTLVAAHEHPIIAHDSKPPRRYIVRRLIPIECARLQGFPDWWGIPDYKTEMTDDELSFWNEVRRVHALVNGKKYKEVKADTLLKWYNKLHTDSAEYKMWGNGIALPCAEYVVGGVVEAIANN